MIKDIYVAADRGERRCAPIYLLYMLLGYLSGCLNGAYYIGKIRSHNDIRTLGSTTAGARNAGRVYGQRAFILTVMIDALKTIVPLGIVLFVLELSPIFAAWMGLAVLIGHIYPFQLQFHGGKGAVVYLATALILMPLSLLVPGLLTLFGFWKRQYLTQFALAGLMTIPAVVALVSDLKLAGIFAIELAVVIIAHIKV